MKAKLRALSAVAVAVVVSCLLIGCSVDAGSDVSNESNPDTSHSSASSSEDGRNLCEALDENADSGSLDSNTKTDSEKPLSFSGVTTATASSTLPTDSTINPKSYAASNLIDGKTATTWCEGASGNGVSESVTLSGSKKQGFKGFDIWNGYQESSHLYDINAKPKSVAVYGDGEWAGDWELEDSGLGSQRIVFDNVIEAKRLTIEIKEVYNGSKYDDCCISEIKCF